MSACDACDGCVRVMRALRELDVSSSTLEFDIVIPMLCVPFRAAVRHTCNGPVVHRR